MIKVKASGEKKAEVLIMDVIGADWFGEGTSAKGVKAALDAIGEVENIDVRINSPGGNVWDGVAIYNLLKQSTAKVTVYIDGLAASAASLIAMAGDTIKMGAGSMMMIHNARALAWGDGDEMRKTADMVDKVNKEMVSLYAARTGMSKKETTVAMNAETWYTPDEAVAAGLADEAITDKVETAATAEWKTIMARFKHVPADIAAMIPAEQQIVITGSLSSAVVETDQIVEAVRTALQTQDTRASIPTPAVTTAQEPASMDEAQKAAIEAKAKADALAAEQARRDNILAAFSKFPAHAALRDTCLNDMTCSVEAARDKLLAKMGEGATPVGEGAVTVGAEARDKFVLGAGQAILSRAGLEKRDAQNEFNGRSLCDLAEMSLRAIGISVKGLTKDGIARKVLAQHTSSDFPLLLSNTAGKVLRNAYQLAPVTWNRWCKIGSVSDFKTSYRHTLGSFSSLLTKVEGGEYKQGTMSEERESITAITKGRFISMSREMLVNDDLGAFTDRSAKMGRAAARTIESDVYTLLTSAVGAGPTMSDTGAFFNATAITTAGGHANLTSSGTAISVASLAVGEAAMMAQKDKSLNDFVLIKPRFLLVAPGKKQIAWEVVNSVSDVGQSNPAKKNYVQAQMNLEVLSSPYLTSTPWWLFADPNDVEAFEVAFLDGVQEPFIDDEIDFMTDAMNMKVRLDYGVAAIDWRAGYRNAGA